MSREKNRDGGAAESAAGDRQDRTFTEEQSTLFETDDTPDKTRRRTPGTQSVPPGERGLGNGKGRGRPDETI